MGKGMTPQKGYDNGKWLANYDAIFRKRRLRETIPSEKTHVDKKKEASRKACRGPG